MTPPVLKSVTEILLMLSDSNRDAYFVYDGVHVETTLTNRAGRVLAVAASADDLEYLRLFGYLTPDADDPARLALAAGRALPSLGDRVSDNIPRSWRAHLSAAYEIERQSPGLILYHSLWTCNAYAVVCRDHVVTAYGYHAPAIYERLRLSDLPVRE